MIFQHGGADVWIIAGKEDNYQYGSTENPKEVRGMKEVTSLKEYESVKKEIALEIMGIFKSKNLSVALMTDILEDTKRKIYRSAKL